MSRFSFSALFLARLALGFGTASLLCTVATAVERAPIDPIVAPFPMPQLQRPDFPERAVNILQHGAVEGGATLNTVAIAKAIDACAQAGGGRVLVPKGRWFTGPIHLRSNIDLHLEEGAELVFSDKPEDYLPVVLVRVGGIELYNYSPFIYARGCSNVAVTGKGRLNGNSKAWWDWKNRESKRFFEMGAQGVPVEKRIFGTREDAIRPNFVVFLDCRNVLLEDFSIGGGPNWTINPVYCENLIVKGVTVDTDGPNNDGIDPDSCRNVLIEDCVFNTGDDCVVLKSGYNEDGWRVGKPTENVVMRRCLAKRGHGGLVIGSEMSGDVRNVYLHDCEFVGTDRAVRIKSKRGRGGVVEKVWVRNIHARDLKQDVVIINMDYGADRNKVAGERAPVFRDLHIADVQADGAPVALRIEGLEDSPIENVTFEKLRISSAKGVLCNNARNLVFSDVSLAVRKGSVYEFSNIEGARIAPAKGAPVSSPLLRLKGGKSGGIVLEKSGLPDGTKLYESTSEVPGDAISLR